MILKFSHTLELKFLHCTLIQLNESFLEGDLCFLLALLKTLCPPLGISSCFNYVISLSRCFPHATNPLISSFSKFSENTISSSIFQCLPRIIAFQVTFLPLLFFYLYFMARYIVIFFSPVLMRYNDEYVKVSHRQNIRHVVCK